MQGYGEDLGFTRTVPVARGARAAHNGRRQWRMKADYVLSHRPRCACDSNTAVKVLKELW